MFQELSHFTREHWNDGCRNTSRSNAPAWNGYDQRSRVGFSLVEMLIVVIVFSLVLGAIYSALNFTSETAQKREVQGELEETGHRLIAEIINELAGARDITDVDDAHIAFISATGQNIRYAHRDEEITKNGILLHPQDIQIEKMELIYFSDDKLDTNQDRRVLVDDFIEQGEIERFIVVPDIQLGNAPNLVVTPEELDKNKNGIYEPDETAPISFVQISVILKKKKSTVNLRSSTALRMH